MSTSPTAHALVIANFVQACCWQMDHAPQAGETCHAHAFHSEPGGKGLNVAVALQRLGVPTVAVLAHGNDAAAAGLRELLQQEGLDTRHVHALDMPSGWGAGFIEPDGQNRIAVFAGANAHLSRAHVQGAQAELAQAAFAYAQLEVAIDAAEEAMRLGHLAGRATVLNPSPWQPLTPVMRASVHTLIVNANEAAQLLATPFQTPAANTPLTRLIQTLTPALHAFWPQHPAARTLVLTLGAWGSVAWERPAHAHASAPMHQAPAPQVAVQDTVGCGDAFSAGYCWARHVQGLPLAQALHVGNACGAHVAAHAGVLAHLPHAAHVRAWLHPLLDS